MTMSEQTFKITCRAYFPNCVFDEWEGLYDNHYTACYKNNNDISYYDTSNSIVCYDSRKEVPYVIINVSCPTTVDLKSYKELVNVIKGKFKKKTTEVNRNVII